MPDPEDLNGPSKQYVREYVLTEVEKSVARLEGKTDQMAVQISSKGTIITVYAGLIALFILASAGYVHHRTAEFNAELNAINDKLTEVIAYQAVSEERFQAVKGIYQAVIGKPFVASLPVEKVD